MDSRNVNVAQYWMVIRSLLMAVLFSASTPSLFAETVEYDQAKLAEIKVLLDGLYEKGQIPNYAVEIRKNGKSVYAAYRGDTELGGSVPVGADTIFWVASMGKPIVSSAVLRLIQDEVLSLDDPLSKFFPQFESMVVRQWVIWMCRLKLPERRSRLEIC